MVKTIEHFTDSENSSFGRNSFYKFSILPINFVRQAF